MNFGTVDNIVHVCGNTMGSFVCLVYFRQRCTTTEKQKMRNFQRSKIISPTLSCCTCCLCVLILVYNFVSTILDSKYYLREFALCQLVIVCMGFS